MARDRYRITAKDHPYFLTCTVVNWIPVFARPEAAEKVLASLQYLTQQGGLTLYGYVIMENHVHMIAAAENLPDALRKFRSFTARTIIDLFKERRDVGILAQLQDAKLRHRRDRTYQLWQEGSHPILMEDEATMRQKLEYMHANPVRRGYVEEPIHWRYSSARNYAGKEGVLDVTLSW